MHAVVCASGLDAATAGKGAAETGCGVRAMRSVRQANSSSDVSVSVGVSVSVCWGGGEVCARV